MTVQDRMARHPQMRASTLASHPTPRECAIQGCGNRLDAKGLCRKHYKRLKRHGDPSIGEAVTRRGNVQKFFESTVLQNEGNDCLIWPFSRNPQGYATVRWKGKWGIASRAICEEVNGPPPSPRHQAAHSCGNGKSGCVTKGHLSWKTRRENEDDKILHGTISAGERNGNAKISQAQASEILSLRGKETPNILAKRFGISASAIGKIHTGKAWACLQKGGI